MLHFAFVLLYVDNPAAAAAFYTELLGRPPVEASPTFALFAMESGAMLGLWSRHAVAPAPAALPGCGEIAVSLAGRDQVLDLHEQWSRRGVAILQAPVEMDFGFTFLAADPDGNRLRVFCAAAP